jgi:hypothetical protein
LRQATNMDQSFRNGEVIWHTVAWYSPWEWITRLWHLDLWGTVLTLPEEKKFWEGRIFNMPGWAKQLEPDDDLKIMLPASGFVLVCRFWSTSAHQIWGNMGYMVS